MKKIAVASEGAVVTGHFGNCRNFLIFTCGENGIESVEDVANPGHKPGFLPNFLADQDVSVVICGGMGVHASEIFNSRGVEVILGASGDSRAAVEAYLKGTLQSVGIPCEHHHHEEH